MAIWHTSCTCLQYWLVVWYELEENNLDFEIKIEWALNKPFENIEGELS
jgi:hypothetical protein